MEKRIARLPDRRKAAARTKSSPSASGRSEFFGDEVLVLEDVAKSYGEKKLFSGIDELIEPGERIALIGDNGTGKSTLRHAASPVRRTPDSRLRSIVGPAVKHARTCRSSCRF